MDISNVYVIIGTGFSKDKIVDIIVQEGYKHNFCFARSEGGNGSNIDRSDEVWCFGDCEGQHDHRMAKALGKDIWIMG